MLAGCDRDLCEAASPQMQPAGLISPAAAGQLSGASTAHLATTCTVPAAAPLWHTQLSSHLLPRLGKRSPSASLNSLMEEPGYRMYLQLIQVRCAAAHANM